MDCTRPLVELFCCSFPEMDRRIIKATVLEYGDDVESAIQDLVDISDQTKDTLFIDNLKVQCCSLLWPCPAADAVVQASIQEEKSQVVGAPPLTNGEELGSPSIPDCSDLQTDAQSTCLVEPFSSTIEKPLATKGSKSETLQDSIDIVNVASALECTVQEARTDIDDVINLIKEVSDLRVKADEERLAAQNAEMKAARGGEDLLMKACDVNKQAQKMKQDNLKLSWEIHGEKSVLALEAKELNVRVEQVKQEKEKMVTTLHEIRDTLQSWYDTALQDRKMAEEEKRLKEEKAGKVLEQEEDLMATIEQETNSLKMEAETCTLLRDFLADHGSIVDALQGEINNLCVDVKYLKEHVQGLQSSTNVASNQELAQNTALCSLSSNSTLSATSTGEMINSFASQYSAPTSTLDLNHPVKTQFLYSSDTSGSIVSKSFDDTIEDRCISYMNNATGSGGGNVKMQELPFIKNSHDLEVPGSFYFRYGANYQQPGFGEHREVIDSNRFSASHHHHSAFGAQDANGYCYPLEMRHHDGGFGQHGDVSKDSNRYGYSYVAMADWGSKIDNAWKNIAGND